MTAPGLPPVLAPAPAPAVSIQSIRRDIAARLRARSLDSPDLDARLLVGHALQRDHAGLMRESARLLTPQEIAQIERLAQRRLCHEPVARILGIKEFWGLEFQIAPAVLVPRPDTETLVETALARIDRDGGRARDLRIADLGVGSGAILIALLHELPRAIGVGTDRDPAALRVARRNAERLGVAARAHFCICDFGAALAPGWDVVVTNPPYIATEEIGTLAPDVRDYDPAGSLDGGADGLAAYRAIASDAVRLVAPNGHFLAEFGSGQGDAVSRLFAQAGLGNLELRPDLAGISRVMAAIRNP